MNNVYQKIKKSQNPKEFWSKNFTIFFLPFFSVLFIKLKIPPNIITLLIIPLSFLSISTSVFINNFSLGLFLISIIGITINIIDFADGAVARYNNKTTIYGKYLDRLCHYIANPSIFLSYALLAIINNYKITGIILIFITLLDLFDVASKDNLYIINLDKKIFSYGKQEKLTFEIKNISSFIIRIFFSSLTSIPHVVFLMYPLFFYHTKLLTIYVFIYLLVIAYKILIRSKSIYFNYKKNEFF